jgi:polyisoprenoid-binding protein YceI
MKKTQLSMKQIAMTILAVAFLIGCSKADPPAGQEEPSQTSPAAMAETYTVDATHSAALFQVKHFGVSFVSGRFTDISGTIDVDRENLSNSSVEIIIRTASVNTDLEERDKHLRNPDFFDVEKYPTMRFKSSEIKKISDTVGEVTGSFTLHGVTKTLTMNVTFLGEFDVPWGQHRAGFETTFNIKRSDYGMDKLLGPAGDNIQIILFVEAMRIDNTKRKTSDRKAP